MNTRTEKIGYITYCAYCGKQLKNDNCGYAIHPEPPMICSCEKAKEELTLYDNLKKLYNLPLAESLVDKKVEKYRNELLGVREPVNITSLASVNVIDTVLNSNVDGVANTIISV